MPNPKRPLLYQQNHPQNIIGIKSCFSLLMHIVHTHKTTSFEKPHGGILMHY
jgi:hypothetical protein